MMDFGFLFSCDYFDHAKPDPDYADEFNEARNRVFSVFLFNADILFQKSKLVFKEIPSKYEESGKYNEQKKPEILIYRGWMLSASQYALLYTELSKIGYTLINTPEQYIACHHLPKWYETVKDDTALSVWTTSITQDSINDKLHAFGSAPVIVKDYVKSRKHEWTEACFIPNASDIDKAQEVVETFIKRQAENLVGGIVLREFVNLKKIGTHPKSNMPIAGEVRIFVFLHASLAEIDYWSGKSLIGKDNNYHALVNKYLSCFSNFFTIDLAQKDDGNWIIIEIGDGQVSGLQGLSVTSFYQAFAKRKYDPDMKNAALSDEYTAWRNKQKTLLFQDKRKSETVKKTISGDLTSKTIYYSHEPEESANFYVCGFERELYKNDKLIYKYRSIDDSGDFCQVISHQDGNQYLIFKRDLYGHSVLNLTNLKDFHYMPAAALKGEEPFIWCNIYYNALNNILVVDGCLWACPYDLLLCDFSKPFEPDGFQFMLHDKDICIDGQQIDEDTDSGGFNPWKGTDLVSRPDIWMN